jgi:ATP-dependent RNA circularization protein (DNA/RNA ligase family)
VLSEEEAQRFLQGGVHVEEKVDGASIGLSLGPDGGIRVQNRGSYLSGKAHRQYDPLWPWISTRQTTLIEALEPGLILFGEWCFAQHSVHYDELPDWFLAFDVYDAQTGAFWCVERRDLFIDSLGLCRVPAVADGLFTLSELVGLLGESRLTSGPMEGIYLRKEDSGHVLARAKIVRAEFTQSIDEHWTKAPFRRNGLCSKATAVTAR